jgi:glycosyltransferase involved in cell wall biosynthesis
LAILACDPSPRARPLLFDLSHLIARLRAPSGSGIDRIDLAFASHILAGPAAGEAVRYRASGPPRRVPRAWAGLYARAARRVWSDREPPRTEALQDWLASPPGDAAKPPPPTPSRPSAATRERLLSLAGHLTGRASRFAPADAVYLNVGFHLFERPALFEWLGDRPDVDGVFMIHDLLPLDYPEYFPPGEAQKCRARIDTALRYGRAFLVATDAVRRRLAREIEAAGLAPRPIWAQPFPSPLAGVTAAAPRETGHPYFVVVGTIEPRKNHLLLLQIWRELAQSSATPPRLVLVGARGWGVEQALDMLDRCEAIRPHVAEASNLGSPDLADLIAGARALLAPSFAEGYGLPVVEALALGTPVVAADTEAAREVSQGRARLLSPLDGPGWAAEIERLAGDPGYHAEQRARAAGFAAPNWPDYFASLERFLDGLRPAQPPANPAVGV